MQDPEGHVRVLMFTHGPVRNTQEDFTQEGWQKKH